MSYPVIQRALDHDNICTFDDLMKYLARCLHAVEPDPEKWGDTADSAKKNINNNARGRLTYNGIRRVCNDG